MALHDAALLKQGFVCDRFPLSEQLRRLVEAENWIEVDRAMGRLLQSDGALFRQLERYHTFTDIEHILAIRDAADPDEEDGIWHDDGSRSLAMTLSLTCDAHWIEGGRLGIRRKGEGGGVLLPTLELGDMDVYLTGRYGYEHRIHRVRGGRRVVVAAWCSDGPQRPNS